MSNETYLNHPTFGLLFRVCFLEEEKELFASLYAQRLFFLVTTSTDGVRFEPITRSDARILVDGQLRFFRRQAMLSEHHQLQLIRKQTFE
ncbi:MAG: PipX family protein [Cyanobacteria bacterium LVE1205-1]|jgi:PII interaction protein X